MRPDCCSGGFGARAWSRSESARAVLSEPALQPDAQKSAVDWIS